MASAPLAKLTPHCCTTIDGGLLVGDIGSTPFRFGKGLGDHCDIMTSTKTDNFGLMREGATCMVHEGHLI